MDYEQGEQTFRGWVWGGTRGRGRGIVRHKGGEVRHLGGLQIALGGLLLPPWAAVTDPPTPPRHGSQGGNQILTGSCSQPA